MYIYFFQSPFNRVNTMILKSFCVKIFTVLNMYIYFLINLSTIFWHPEKKESSDSMMVLSVLCQIVVNNFHSGLHIFASISIMVLRHCYVLLRQFKLRLLFKCAFIMGSSSYSIWFWTHLFLWKLDYLQLYITIYLTS